MKRALVIAGAIILAIATPAAAHRVDEYLQATTLQVSRGRLQLDMRLAPGVAVASMVLDSIDINRDGAISETEGQRYGRQVLRDVSLRLDDVSVPLRVISVQTAPVDELKRGQGEILLGMEASLPVGSTHRRLVFENRHRSAIAAYLVNALVPEERDLYITSQTRDYRQSSYEMTYEQSGAGTSFVSFDTLIKWSLVGVAVVLAVATSVASLRRRAANRVALLARAPTIGR